MKTEDEEELSLDALDFDHLATAVTQKSLNKDNPLPPAEGGENTIRLVNKKSLGEIDSKKTNTKISYGLPSKQRSPKSDYSGKAGASVEATLKQSEHLRIAQNKLNALEDEVDKLRRENADLASAGQTFKRINDEYYGSIETLKQKVVDIKTTYNQEVELLKNINKGKDKQIVDLKQQIDDLKSRVDDNFRGVRKREKDLEHRLEIAKIEEAAVIKSKDQLILDLKRRIDQVTMESENFRQKSQENYKELQKKQNVVRGVIRALRIALTKLEGDDDSEVDINIGSHGNSDDSTN